MTQIVIPNLNIPQQVPGAFLGDDILSNLGEWANQVAGAVNNISINITNTMLTGLTPDFYTVGTAQGPLTNAGMVFAGNQVLQLTTDGQLVCMWMNKNSTTLEAYAVKSAPPFIKWTGIDGGANPTSIYANSGATSGSDNYVAFCQDTGTKEIVATVADGTQATSKVYVIRLSPDGAGNWTVTGNAVVQNSPISATSIGNCCDIISPYSGAYLCNIDPQVGGGAGYLWINRSTDPLHTWTTQVKYLRIKNAGTVYGAANYASGPAKRLIPMDGSYVLALGEFADSAGRINIAYSISADYGQTWQVTTDSLVSDVLSVDGDQTTGALLPMAVGGTPTSNIESATGNPGGNTQWNACYIPGTTRVALVYHGDDSNSRNPGVYYCEFDRTANSGTGGWTAQDNHVRLNRYKGEGTPTITVDKDGTTRVLWLHALSQSFAYPPVQISYRVCPAGQSPLTLGNWQTERNVFTLFSSPSTNSLLVNQMCVLRSGTMSAKGVTMLPVLLGRVDPNPGSVNPKVELLVKFLPIAAMDA